MAHVSGKNGGVYTGALLIHDCETAWDDASDATCTPSRETGGKVGTYFVRGTVVAAGADVMLMAEDITKDLTAYDGVMWWARCSITTALGNLHLLLDETADCISPEEELDFPALTLNVWRRCFALLDDPSPLNAVVSVGIDQVIDLADLNIDVDDVQALAEVDGIQRWSLDYTVTVLDVTDFADAGVGAFIPGISQWSGSFEGTKDGPPLTIGSEVHLALGETNTVGNEFLGKAILTDVHPAVDFDGLVTYSYDFQGTGDLETPGT